MRLQAEFRKKVKTETIEISLDLENEVLGILGRSGCGKSAQYILSILFFSEIFK